MLSTIIRKILENLSIFFSNDLNNLKFDNKTIYKTIESKIEIINKSSDNLKVTHKIFNENLYKILKEKKLKNFVHNRFFIFKELKELRKNKRWIFYKKLLCEDCVGDPVRYFLYPNSSGNRINHVYHLSCLEKELNIDLNSLENIFEFGGGYGCMARIFSNINNQINYKIFDTKLVNCLQYYYLKQNDLDVGFDGNKFCLINDFQKLNYNDQQKNSLFIANWSLSEVPLILRDSFELYIENFENIMICFQENFEEINNLKYFENLKQSLKDKYEIKIKINKFYKGNILNPERHYFFFGKKL